MFLLVVAAPESGVDHLSIKRRGVSVWRRAAARRTYGGGEQGSKEGKQGEGELHGRRAGAGKAGRGV